MSDSDRLLRREILLGSAALVGSLGFQRSSKSVSSEPPYNASGERVGEIRPDSAIVHVRLTAVPTRNNSGYTFPTPPRGLGGPAWLKKTEIPKNLQIADLEGSCAGKAGRVRVHYSLDPALARAQITDWVEVGPATDYTHHFTARGLKPRSPYYYSVEMAATTGRQTRRGAIGKFVTAPEPSDWKPVKFCAISCQSYRTRDDPRGYRTYQSMIREGADFVASIGDMVYYDTETPLATNVNIARFHWQRIYSQPLAMEMCRNMAGYWLKDDHDSCEDDNWPTRPSQRVAPMTYSDLAPIFQEQMPIGPQTYRQARWGKGLELWFSENRDYRSPNWDPDGPNKTIWGAKQKEWLKRSLLASDADFRILVSPNCVVGPDPEHGSVFQLPMGGADSHCDGGFSYEGREFRRWVKENGLLKNFLVINGDRHWQYHSVDTETGLNEICTGAVTDAHSTKNPVHVPSYHRFIRGKGGYLSVALQGTKQDPSLQVRINDVDGNSVYEFRMKRNV